MTVWRTSTHSGNESNCVEMAVWRKSARSENYGNRIEVAPVDASAKPPAPNEADQQ